MLFVFSTKRRHAHESIGLSDDVNFRSAGLSAIAETGPLFAQHDRIGRIARHELDGDRADHRHTVRGQFVLQIGDVLRGGVDHAGDAVRIVDRRGFELIGSGLGNNIDNLTVPDLPFLVDCKAPLALNLLRRRALSQKEPDNGSGGDQYYDNEEPLRQDSGHRGNSGRIELCDAVSE